jgi:hypothetical protein
MKKLQLYVLLFGIICFVFVPLSTAQRKFKSGSKTFATLSEKVNYYKNKYKVKCTNEKITDNQGNGFDSLYGTRNMRTILFGIAYRGGANNFYHKLNKRDNHNPLPEDGLQNLCEQGFSSAVYLYSTNFKNSPKSYASKNSSNILNYKQNSASNQKDLRKIMTMVKEVIDSPNLGPIYFHCWNGWHQSGFVSAAILKQFCKYSNDDAFQYWLKNTDGVNEGCEKMKIRIEAFKPFDDIFISDSLRNEICPCRE